MPFVDEFSLVIVIVVFVNCVLTCCFDFGLLVIACSFGLGLWLLTLVGCYERFTWLVFDYLVWICLGILISTVDLFVVGLYFICLLR